MPLSAAEQATINQGSIDAANAANAKAGITSAAPAGSTFVDPATNKPVASTPQALLVTSNQSRAVTANNVANMQAANTSMAPKATGNAASMAGTGGQQNTASPDPTMNGGTTINIHAPAPTPTNDPTKAGQPGYDTFGAPVAAGSPVQGGVADGKGGVTLAGGTNGGVQTQGSAPSSTSTGDPTQDNINSAVSQLDPSLQGIYRDQLTQQQQTVTDAQTTLDSATKLYQGATNGTDSAMLAAAQQIKDTFAVLIKQMQDKNVQILGRANASVGAFGGLGQMSQNFLSNETDRATQRVADLTTKMNDLILRSNIAYQNNDLKALNAAQTAFQKAKTDQMNAIRDLAVAANNNVKANQAQAKLDAANTKQALAADVTKSTNLGVSIAKNIADAGLTDPGQVSDYIASIAQEYGISNPAILSSAVTKAQQTQQKLDLSKANITDTIANRDAGTVIKQQNANKVKASSTKFNSSTAIASVLPQMKAEVKASGSTDGYIDPNKWVAARDVWQQLGGTAATFKSNFIQFLNPTSYPIAGYKAPAASAGQTYSTTPTK